MRLAWAWLLAVGWTATTFTALEWLWPRRRSVASWRRMAVGAALLAIDAALMKVITVPSSSSSCLRCAATWVVAELLAYWIHRAMHRVPLLWRFHRLHHSGEVSWSHAWLVHPVDAALFALSASTACMIVGGSLPAIAAYVVGRRAWTVLLHANIRWPASRLDHLIATPPFHQRHHERGANAANFAGTLPILDHLFGTWQRGQGNGDRIIGRNHLISKANLALTRLRLGRGIGPTGHERIEQKMRNDHVTLRPRILSPDSGAVSANSDVIA